MSALRFRVLLAAGMTASLLSALAVAESSGATTPDVSMPETSVVATPDTVADTSIVTTPEGAAMDVLPPDESWAGVTRAEWTARAWQWWLSFPEDIHPSFDASGERCGYGQSGPVFFLPLAYADVVDFSCVVAEGTAIYVTALYAECSTTEPAPFFGRSEDELRACTRVLLDGGTHVRARVNGQEVADLDAYRIGSPLFTLTLSENNLNLAEPGVAQAVAESYNLIIAPPSPGDYEIVVSWLYGGPPEVVATYNVTVEAPQVLEAPPTT